MLKKKFQTLNYCKRNVILTVIFIYIIYYFLLSRQIETRWRLANFNAAKNYAISVEKTRLNKLFEILLIKEKSLLQKSNLAEKLNLISFSRLVDSNLDLRKLAKKDAKRLEPYEFYLNNFLTVENGVLKVTDECVRHFRNISNFYSFLKPRNFTKKNKINRADDLPVFVTAADAKYYAPLVKAIKNMRKYFKKNKLIVYDLGMSDENRKNVEEICECEVRIFDMFGEYRKHSKHISNLNTYSWKPLLIQEVFSEYESLVYMDSSIIYNTSEIGSVIEMGKEVGILTRYLDLKLTCYTDPRMFEWFGSDANQFTNVFTLEANFIILHRNFLSEIIMKAWVTCALDPDCIAPKGAHIYGGLNNWLQGCSACGCHRFDQDALSIISTFFFSHPMSLMYTPAYALTYSEMFFFEVKRRNVFIYIFDQIRKFF